MALLPTARVPRGDLLALLSGATRAPGLSADTLRLRTRLERGAFATALSACVARGLLRQSKRPDNHRPRTRIFPTGKTDAALADLADLADPADLVPPANARSVAEPAAEDAS